MIRDPEGREEGGGKGREEGRKDCMMAVGSLLTRVFKIGIEKDGREEEEEDDSDDESEGIFLF